MRPLGIGFSPDGSLHGYPQGMGYAYRESAFDNALQQLPAMSDEAAALRSLRDFWRTENTVNRAQCAFPQDIRAYMPSDNFQGDVGVGFPLYRMTGGYANFELLVTLGLPGLKEKIARHLTHADAGQAAFLQGLATTVNILRDCSLHYANQAQALAAESSTCNAQRMAALADDLFFLADHAPLTLHQAIQLIWLYVCVADLTDYGRLDLVLGSFLEQDLQNGTLTEAAALEEIKGLWQLIAARKTIFHGRVVIGGRGRKNKSAANHFAMLAMQATNELRDIEPQLTLRFYDGQDPRLMQYALEVISQGATYPMLYNDDVNIPAVMTAMNVPQHEAEQYVPFGCGEFILDHQSMGTPNGVINMLKALEVTIFGGQELVHGQPVGLNLGSLTDYPDFEALYNAYCQQLEHFIRLLADASGIIQAQTAAHSPFLMLSLLYGNCIEKGCGLFDGGMPYVGATLESYGNINTVDSLAAIRYAVYDRKLISAERLMAALRADFVGYEAERPLLLKAPKYGNDNPYVDEIAARLHDFEARIIREQAQRVGLDSFLLVVINNSANTYLGKQTGASADGRRACTFMANANNPTGGMDKTGLTAMFNSLLTFPAGYHAGVVQNLRLSRELFLHHREQTEALIRGYFAAGGTQLMITVTGREELEDALVHPERHRSLLVRVGGFSARFVNLEKDVQQEVLSRTCY